MLSEAGLQPEAEYDAFEALCEILFPDGENGLMFFWKSHYDASGGDPWLVVAGYLADRHKWKAFRQAWTPLLTNPDGSVSIFHATDFESGSKAFTEEKGWPKARRDKVRVQLVDALVAAQLDTPVICSVNVKEYDELIQGWRRERMGNAYEFCVNAVLTLQAAWCQRAGNKQPIENIVEAGDEGQGKVQAAFMSKYSNLTLREFFRMGALVFHTKEQVMQLQAADMLAHYFWEWRSRGKQPLGEPYNRVIGENWTRCWEDYDGAKLRRISEQEEREGLRAVFPEGEITFRPGERLDIDVQGDFSAVEELLGTLERSVETSPDLVYSLVKNAAAVSKLIGVEVENTSTEVASNLRVVFKPKDFALEGMSALRALERDENLSK